VISALPSSPLFQAESGGFVPVPDFTPYILVAAYDFHHALFDGLEVFRGEGIFPVEVVVKAVFDSRANGDLGSRKQLLHRFCHDMGSIVADQIQAVVSVAGDDFHRGAIVDGQVNIDQLAVHFGGKCLFGEFFADTLGDVQGGRRLIKRHGCPVGQLIADTHER